MAAILPVATAGREGPVLGFMCTRPAGWEAEDVGSLLGVLTVAAVVLVVSWLIGRRWPAAGAVRVLRIGLTLVIFTPLAVMGAVVVYLAPC